jgi:hypothetical protein
VWRLVLTSCRYWQAPLLFERVPSQRLWSGRAGSNRPKPQGVIGTQLHHYVLAVGARLGPDINGNIDNRAVGAEHRLGLRVRRRLALQASQRAPSVGVGDVRLRDAGEQSLAEFVGAEGP